MKSNSVFLVFAATVVIVGLLLWYIFASTPANNLNQKPAPAAAATPADAAAAGATAPSGSPATAAPTATATAAPTATPSSRPAASAGAGVSSAQVAIDPGVLADFTAVRTNALDMIPTDAEIQKLTTEQVHFTPKAVIAAATEIGRVAEMVEAHPELSSRGLQFYKECAEKESAVDSIRATCLSDFNNLQTRAGQNTTPPKVPKRIALLAEKLSS